MAKSNIVTEMLYLPFDEIKSRKGRGGTYDYIPWKAVADRMNDVFGVNWSSHVTYQDKFDDQIIIRVTVCVYDAATKREFCQDGYGGAIFRSSDEPGTAFKAACSKALKDACKKWGVALSIDADDNDSAAPPAYMPPGFGGYETASVPAQMQTPPAAVAPTPPVQQPVMAAPPTVPTPPVAQAPIQQSAPVQPMSPAMGFAPQPPAAPEAPAAQPLPATPAPAGINGPQAPAAPMVQPGPPAPAAIKDGTDFDPTEPGSISNVQKMAIVNLSRTVGIEGEKEVLEKVVNVTMAAMGRQLKSIDELSYLEAVEVIKTIRTLQK